MAKALIGFVGGPTSDQLRETARLHQRIAEMADPLHFGSFGGWPIRLIWFLFGAALTTLCFTGVYLYGLRVADALRSMRRRSAS